MPRLDETVNKKLKGLDLKTFIKEKHFKNVDCDVSFERRRERVVIRSSLGRLVFQQVHKRDGGSLERVFETLRHERP
jgi:hypothetical protein